MTLLLTTGLQPAQALKTLKWQLCYRRLLYTALYPFTYLRTPWSRVLLEKLTGSQLVKKFPAFYGTRRFITVFISARHLSLS